MLISDVASASPAAKAGLRRGDVVVAIDGRTLTSAAKATERSVLVLVDRDGATLFLSLSR